MSNINKNMFNLEAEAEILGAIINDNNLFCEVIDVLSYEDFASPKHQVLYKVMVELYNEYTPIDVITLSEKAKGILNEFGGITYISTLIGASFSSLNIKFHAEIVKEKAKLRKLMQTMRDTIEKLNCEEAKSTAIVNGLSDSLLKLQVSIGKEDGSLEPHLTNFLERLKERVKNGGGINGISTGYKVLDKVTGGFSKGDYIILAGRPSMGKSALSINLALNAALKEKAKVAYFNLEMTAEQTVQRSIASIAEYSMKNLKNADIKEKDWNFINEGISALKIDNLRVFESALGINEIKAQCKRLKLQHGLDVVFIDYLQLIQGEERYESRNIDITNISRSLKLLAKELDITVIALSQLSRAPEARNDHRPMLSDLRDSGAIEQDADIVMLLYRDAYYNSDSETKDLIECIIGKNRNGEVGTVKLKWKPEYQKVE